MSTFLVHDGLPTLWRLGVTTVICFNDRAAIEIYTLSLHDALPISASRIRNTASHHHLERAVGVEPTTASLEGWDSTAELRPRSEEHTSELQSQFHLVCRLLLEKKK